MAKRMLNDDFLADTTDESNPSEKRPRHVAEFHHLSSLPLQLQAIIWEHAATPPPSTYLDAQTSSRQALSHPVIPDLFSRLLLMCREYEDEEEMMWFHESKDYKKDLCVG